MRYVRRLKLAATEAAHERRLAALRDFLKLFKYKKISEYLDSEWATGEQ